MGALMEWSGLREFLIIADVGTLSGAARQLGVTQPTLSRRLLQLEEHLDLTLFNRTRRGLELTAGGEKLLEYVRKMDATFVQMRRAARHGDDRAQGRVEVAVPQAICQDWLVPRMLEFRRQAPDVGVDFTPIDSLQDTRSALRAADILVTYIRPRRADSTVRRVGTLRTGLFASRSYLEARGRPETVSDLRGHAAVGLTEELQWLPEAQWLTGAFADCEIAMRSSKYVGVSAMVRAGFGIGALPTAVGGADPGLQRVLPELVIAEYELWLVSHADLRRSARIRALFDYLVTQFESEPRFSR